jgi:hypothetical protein
MLSLLQQALAWLTAIDPALPRALLVSVVFAAVYLLRKAFPRAWELFASVVPVPVIDPAPLLLLLSKSWQALPGALLGAAAAALASGADVRSAVKGALFGALAALAHEVAKAVPWLPYKGEVGRFRGPPTLPVLYLFVPAALVSTWPNLTGCARDFAPCSTEDFATGPLALHNASCAAERQAKFPETPDDKCDSTPGCKAIVDRCDRWVEERCK